jgi:hypothetical protein
MLGIIDQSVTTVQSIRWVLEGANPVLGRSVSVQELSYRDFESMDISDPLFAQLRRLCSVGV